eukprot:1159803-Pelagomonas_calceolata.AAC.5
MAGTDRKGCVALPGVPPQKIPSVILSCVLVYNCAILLTTLSCILAAPCTPQQTCAPTNIHGLPEVGTVVAVDVMDDGSPIRLAVTINRREGTAVFDFEGTGAYVPSLSVLCVNESDFEELMNACAVSASAVSVSVSCVDVSDSEGLMHTCMHALCQAWGDVKVAKTPMILSGLSGDLIMKDIKTKFSKYKCPISIVVAALISAGRVLLAYSSHHSKQYV